MFLLKLYILTLTVFLGIDMLWLGVIAKGFYARNLGTFLRSPPLWIAAGVFYLINIAGILIFVVLPALEQKSLSKAVTLGVLFGLFTYATYDLTNLATLKDWPLSVTLVDIAWGMTLTGLVSMLSYLIAGKL